MKARYADFKTGVELKVEKFLYDGKFPAFLSAEEMAKTDEYADEDPYSVEENLTSAFHERRTELTVEFVRLAIANFSSPVRILDIGCGQGHVTDKIRQAIPDSLVAGMDYSLSAITYAHRNFPDVEFCVGNVYRCPYEENQFDVVVLNNIWEHVGDPLFLLSTVRQILKPAGMVVISTPSRYRIENLVRVIIGRPVRMMSHHHVTEYSVGQVREQLAFGGFEVERIASRPIDSGQIKVRVAKSLMRIWLRLIGSSHQLEATVFYLARSTKK